MSNLTNKQDVITAIKDADVFVTYDAETDIDDVIEITIANTKNSAIESIKELPSAEPKRKKGKWTWFAPNGFKCSECDRYLKIAAGNVKMNYCPNCGSRNIEEGEQDEN